MRNGKDIKSCLFGEELVAYIYDELQTSGRAAFEEHLLDCSGCTAEFAEISISRLGVFEWHRDEFLPLATPTFAIPYYARNVASITKISWLDALRGLVASPPRVAFAGGAMAVIALAFGFTFLSNAVSPGALQARVPDKVEPVKIDIPAPMVAKNEVGTAPVAINVVQPAKHEYRTVERTQRTHSTVVKFVEPNRKVSIPATSATNVPRLGNYVETEDTSLRLADLVADIDTKEY